MAITKPFKPTKQQLIDAAGKTLPDVIAPNLRVLFCGINPGLYTAAVGHHFARPGNRFWPALHKSGFTDRLISPFDERELLQSGIGISNVVPFDRDRRATDERGFHRRRTTTCCQSEALQPEDNLHPWRRRVSSGL